jgi:hypothetical protein
MSVTPVDPGEVRTVTAPEVPKLVAELTSPTRARPVVLVSIAFDSGQPRVDPWDLATQVGSKANVILLADRAAVEAWSAHNGRGWDTYGGAVRILPTVSRPAAKGLFTTYQASDAPETVSRILERLGLPDDPTGPAALRYQSNSAVRGELSNPSNDHTGRTKSEWVESLSREFAAIVETRVREAVAEADSLADELARELALQRDSFAQLEDKLYLDVVYADPEKQFRFALNLRFLRSLPEAERQDRPLAPYELGSQWLEDLHDLSRDTKVRYTKLLDVVISVLRGEVWHNSAREVHQLRSGPGAQDPVMVRDNGAVAWRASLQRHTPQARRVMWWAHPDGHVELARISSHDDLEVR